MLIDLHNHTSRYSDDSLLSPEHLIEVAKKAGLDGIAVTEHDFFWDHDELVDIGKRMDFLVIPGCRDQHRRRAPAGFRAGPLRFWDAQDMVPEGLGG